MHVVILTQYYPPETGAPQNRLHALSQSLVERDHEVEVLTAMPNYPDMKIHKGYKGKISTKETIDGVKVRRCWLWVSKSKGLISRMMNYLSFATTSFWIGLFTIKRGGLLILESPPLFLALTAMPLARLKGMKLVTNISDLWPESAVALGLVTNKSAIRLSERLERKMYRRSALISGQTQGIVANIQGRFAQKQCIWFPNGADLDHWTNLNANDAWAREMGLDKFDFVAGYAGVIGHAQGLEIILQAAHEIRSEFNVAFVIVGHGPEKEALMNLKEELELDNIFFVDAVTKSEMRGILPCFDFSLVPLRKSPLFLGAIPSKIFESLAAKVPVILGVKGEAEELFVNLGQCALGYEPGDSSSLAQALKQVCEDSTLRQQLAINGSEYVRENFDRRKVNGKFVQVLEAL